MKDTSNKVRENLLRRMAERQDMRIIKIRRRDPHAIDYGLYRLVDNQTNANVLAHASANRETTLENIEAFLTNMKGATRYLDLARISLEFQRYLKSQGKVIDEDAAIILVTIASSPKHKRDKILRELNKVRGNRARELMQDYNQMMASKLKKTRGKQS